MANPEHVEVLKQGVEVWNQWREDNPDINPDLSFFHFSKEEVEGTPLACSKLHFHTWDSQACMTMAWVNLDGINLSDADLREAVLMNVHLEDANLSRAVLVNTSLDGAHLGGSNMEGAYAICSNLTGANMAGVNLHKANLLEAHAPKANLFKADLTETILVDTNLKHTNLANVVFCKRSGAYRGIRLDGCYGNERYKRFALHQAFIEELRESSFWNKLLTGIWSVLADCGRTPWVWITWSATFCLYYAGIYLGLGATAFDFDTSLPFNFGSTLYYSIVTFTTLGFGDITPATGLAAFYVTLEVITGYVMLGGLISFIFSKLLPRG